MVRKTVCDRFVGHSGTFPARNPTQPNSTQPNPHVLITVFPSQPDVKYCWNCFLPLIEPKLVGSDETTQKMIENGEIRLDTDEKIAARATELYKTLEVPQFKPKNVVSVSQENNVHFCSAECSKEAHHSYGPLLQSLRTNEPPVEAARNLDEGGFVSFNLFSRLLAKATRNPRQVEDIMNRYDSKQSNVKYYLIWMSHISFFR